MKGKNILLGILLVLLCIALGIGIGYLISNKVSDNDVSNSENVSDNNTENDKNNNGTTNNQFSENILKKVEIKNEEVKELYNYVESGLKSNYVCLGYFYQNPFSKHDLDDKVSLVLLNYGAKYEKEIDDKFLKKINAEDRTDMKANSSHYIDADIIREGMKKIFNVDIDTFKEPSDEGKRHYSYIYNKEADAFVNVFGGGSYDADIYQQIVEYNELDNEINLIVVKAEIGYDDNVYRYANSENTLVYKNLLNNEFKFTEENVDLFPQLKYVFKKNNNGKYYVSDIINLNFKQDYATCE